MKSFAVAMAFSSLALSLLGCSDSAQQTTQDRSLLTQPTEDKEVLSKAWRDAPDVDMAPTDDRSREDQPLTEEDVLSKAQAEIATLGMTPDQDMMKALEKLGFKPSVTPFNDGWKVAHPLGQLAGFISRWTPKDRF